MSLPKGNHLPLPEILPPTLGHKDGPRQPLGAEHITIQHLAPSLSNSSPWLRGGWEGFATATAQTPGTEFLSTEKLTIQDLTRPSPLHVDQ